MADPLSIGTAVVGLVMTAGQLGGLSKQLWDSATGAPDVISVIHEEMDHLYRIFGHVETLVNGDPQVQKKINRTRLTMIPLHDLMTILTGCVLIFSKLDEKMCAVAGLDPKAQKPAKGVKFVLGRVNWALWKETEVTATLQELQRFKLSLNLMLGVIQCKKAGEAEEKLEKLQEMVEKILESTQNLEICTQLQGLISRDRHNNAFSDDNSPQGAEENTNPSISITTSGTPSLTSTSTTPSSILDRADSASIRTTATVFSIRSVRSIIPSFTDELFSSRAYKRLRRPGSNPDSSSTSIFSKDSRATKGDRWSMLSDLSLGSLSISEISVLELPICLSDLHDSQTYMLAAEAQSKEHPPLVQPKRSIIWSSRGRIHSAIQSDNSFLLKTLANLGADLDEKDKEGRTPLRYAVELGRYTMCKVLLDGGAAVDAPDSVGRTPLLYAAATDTFGIYCQSLVSRGAVVDTTDCIGRTPLSYAAEKGLTRACRILVELGATVDAPDSSGRTPLSYTFAVGSSRSFITEVLVNLGANVDYPDSKGRTPLSYAAEVGDSLSTQALVNLGANVDYPDSKGRTPLSYAAGAGHSGSYKALASLGANINCPDLKGRTPLSHAAEKGLSRTCRRLVKLGATVDAPDSSGRTPLSYAVEKGLNGTCRILVELGATVDAPDSSGRTPMSYAAEEGLIEMCRIQAKLGATEDAPDLYGAKKSYLNY